MQLTHTLENIWEAENHMALDGGVRVRDNEREIAINLGKHINNHQNRQAIKSQLIELPGDMSYLTHTQIKLHAT